jgi:hypothetical protein
MENFTDPGQEQLEKRELSRFLGVALILQNVNKSLLRKMAGRGSFDSPPGGACVRNGKEAALAMYSIQGISLKGGLVGIPVPGPPRGSFPLCLGDLNVGIGDAR